MNFLTYEENVILSVQCCGSAAFFKGNADRDPTLHFDADPDPDLSQSFTHIGDRDSKSEKNSDAAVGTSFKICKCFLRRQLKYLRI
jgi:hypothetical protein